MKKIRDIVLITCLILMLMFGITTSADTLATKTKAESYEVVYCCEEFGSASGLTAFLNRKKISKENIVFVGMDVADTNMSFETYTLIYKK